MSKNIISFENNIIQKLSFLTRMSFMNTSDFGTILPIIKPVQNQSHKRQFKNQYLSLKIQLLLSYFESDCMTA